MAQINFIATDNTQVSKAEIFEAQSIAWVEHLAIEKYPITNFL